MRMTEKEIQDMLNAYPGLTYQRKQEADIFQGRIEICHNETSSNVILTGEFGMKIVVNDEYPENIPVVYDVNDSINSDYIHRYSNGELCLESGIRLQLFARKHSQKEFIDFFLINYLCSYLYYDRYLMYPNGERPHGFWGEYDFLLEYFSLAIDKVVSILRYILFHGIKIAGVEKIYFELLNYLKGRDK